MAWLEDSFDIAGKIPKASHVKKIIFLGCDAILFKPLAIKEFSIWNNGYDTLVFSVFELSVKSIFLVTGSNPTFSNKAPCLIAL